MGGLQQPRMRQQKSLSLPNNRLQGSSVIEMNKAPYTSEFFDTIRGGSRRSAQAVVPIVLQLVQPKSIIDVGCGDGSWLSVFRELGVSDMVGLDGDYVDRRLLQIPQDQFRATDLSSPFGLSRTFDLAICLEVAEHLPPQSAEGFVNALTQLAPGVLFSAAIPLQGGTQHLNEQWPDYWAALFKTHDYLPIDCIRERIWKNENVEWFYAQNILLFASAERMREDSDLRRRYEKTNLQQLALVHPRRFLQPFRCGVRGALRLLAQATINATRKRVRVLPGERY
jgi:2-polyprenyl-3-methyl-5-hydroxy-6-metoxy-1,4-benzoquinol methylase